MSENDFSGARAPAAGDAAPAATRSLSDPERWVEEHGDYLFKYALLRLHDMARAEDAVQETFLAALKGAQKQAQRACLESRCFGANKRMNWLSKLSSSLARGVVLVSPSCQEATRLQSEAMDRRLSLFERIGLQLHLLLCKWCRRYGSQLKFLRSAAHRCEEHESLQPSQRLSPEARERIKEKLQSSQE